MESRNLKPLCDPGGSAGVDGYIPGQEAGMELFWLDKLAHLEALSQPKKSKTKMYVKTPFIPWIYLLDCPVLYRYCRYGFLKPRSGGESATDFPDMEPGYYSKLRKRYASALHGLERVSYLLARDMTLNICLWIESFYDKTVIGVDEKEKMYREVAGALDKLENDCQDFSLLFRVEYNYCDLLRSVPGDDGGLESENRAVSAASVVIAGPGLPLKDDNYGLSYQNSYRISHSNAVDRIKFFGIQRSDLENFKKGK